MQYTNLTYPAEANTSSSMKVGVAIPTYNEKANLAPLIENLSRVFEAAGVALRIVIVDDNSPDGTGELADSIAQKRRNVSVIHRSGKLGLGSAYKAAFKLLLNDPQVAVVMEMDADFSHQPKYIPSLLSKIEEGYDVAIGSRYVRGGGIDKEWTAMRRLISKSANVLAVMFAGLNVKDATGGFRAYDSYALKSIDLSKVRTNGYAFQIDMLSQCRKVGCEIAEVPIVFYERKHGKSKLARTSMLEFLKTLESAFFCRVFSLAAVAVQSSVITVSNALWIGIKPLQAAIKHANEQNLLGKRERAFSR
ncbi:MAG: polyprenol monophosphomannose synthase [Candidatus Bathyarchaeota archaeon]|nr:polyprenol monophosphomannose synthase [Candidatus Bathyarchaeota archaeon]